MLRQIVSGALLLMALLPLQLTAAPSDDLQTAAKKGKVAFLMVTDPTASGIEQAKSVIKDAMKEIRKATLVELDRMDVANTAFVQKYSLAVAPVPLILVFASNGALCGGAPAEQLTPEHLIRMIPSPKKAEVLKEIQNGRSVFITASKGGMASESKVTSACAAACGQMMGKSATVQIDLSDNTESAFLNELKINPQSAEPVTVVINAQGQVTGSFQGAVEVGNLVQAATKKAGGCCPTGSGATCGPKKP